MSERMTTAHLSDVLPHGHLMDGRIRAAWPHAHCAGPAFTVRTAPGDNASALAAIQAAKAGDVLVIDGGGFVERALWGAIMARAAQLRGIAGVVLDAAIRDVEEIEHIGFPAFAVARTPAGPYNKVAGGLGEVVRCGGLTVHPGDYVLADGDGVIVVPATERDAALARAEDRISREREILDGLDQGNSLPELLPILRREGSAR